jgi:predicted GNAT family acetyltransferase
MTIQNKQQGENGVFYITGNNGENLAEMTYRLREPHTMIIDHTEVSDELKGQKIGYQLVDAGVEYAREKGLKIVPLCVFAAAVFKKRPEYADVLMK